MKRRKAVIAKSKPKSAKKPLLDLLLQALSAMYANDKLFPGVTLSWLDDRKKFYGSICAYPPECLGKPPYKRILLKVEGDSVMDVLQKLAQGWFDRTEPIMEFKQRMRSDTKVRRIKQAGKMYHYE
jgi:hypothetical protein